MKPTPWMSEAVDPGERKAADALADMRAEPTPWTPAHQREVLDAIRARTSAPQGLQPHHAIMTGAALALAALVIVVVRPHAPAVVAPIVEASADAKYQLTPASSARPAWLQVAQGAVRVSAPSSTRFDLEAPGLRGHVDARLFRVQVAGASCLLSLDDGTAELFALDGRVVYVPAGQSIHSADARLGKAPIRATPVPTVAPNAPSAGDPCQGAPALEVRRACYQQAARGNDLAAQNAVLELGMIEQEQAHDGAAALSAWRSYQKRFPGGPLAPEASVAILGELLAEHRLADARREADGFLADYPADGRVGEIRLTRADLQCEMGGADALSDFDRLEQSSGIDRAELGFRRGNCEERMGRRDDARTHWRQALELAPTGRRAGELRKLLAN